MNSYEIQNPDGAEKTTSATAEPSGRRRLLLKGALSAPVIMTLYSGAALARSSNWITTTNDPNIASLGGGDNDSDSYADNGYACAFGQGNVDSDQCGSSFTAFGEKCDLGDQGELFGVERPDLCGKQGGNAGILVYASHACSSFTRITKTNLTCPPN